MKLNSVPLLLGGLLAATPLTAAPNPAPDYVAHEWGTFTSVQGSDGELILWNPFVETDLPEFVYTRERPCPMTPELQRMVALQRLLLKSSNHWLQRMETPVIYFHAREDFTVNVSVDFPKGLITEWYPAASVFGPASGDRMFTPDTKRSHLDWQQLRVLGGSPNVTRVPTADGPSHFFIGAPAISRRPCGPASIPTVTWCSRTTRAKASAGCLSSASATAWRRSPKSPPCSPVNVAR
jgi:hypothetical protein